MSLLDRRTKRTLSPSARRVFDNMPRQTIYTTGSLSNDKITLRVSTYFILFLLDFMQKDGRRERQYCYYVRGHHDYEPESFL